MTQSFPGRKKTIPVKVGAITIGGDAPVVVQSMTNTDTEDVIRTTVQCRELAEAGSEMVRVTVNTIAAARAVPEIVERLANMGCEVPLVGDFHYNGHKLLTEVPECGQALAKYRINPGNVGRGSKRDEQFAAMIECAVKWDKPVRIGVNWGSLDQDLLAKMLDENAQKPDPSSLEEVMHESLIASALYSAEKAEALGLARDKIILSCKLSEVNGLVKAYQTLSTRCDYPMHLGLTEAGMGAKGIIASTAGLSILLNQGIGDTIRVSLTPEPGKSRTEEVKVAQQVLQSLGLRSFTPQVIACPGCGRTTSDYFQRLAQQIQQWLTEQMPVWRKQYQGVESMHVAVMGCVVNGPGESKFADIGISLPGSGESPIAPVYEDGKRTITLKGENIAAEFQSMVQDYVVRRYG